MQLTVRSRYDTQRVRPSTNLGGQKITEARSKTIPRGGGSRSRKYASSGLGFAPEDLNQNRRSLFDVIVNGGQGQGLPAFHHRLGRPGPVRWNTGWTHPHTTFPVKLHNNLAFPATYQSSRMMCDGTRAARRRRSAGKDLQIFRPRPESVETLKACKVVG